MGRKKLVLKPIENAGARKRKYQKRIASLMKKAHELGVLCGADVLLMVVSYDDSTSQARTLDTFDRYCSLPDEVALAEKCIALSRNPSGAGHRYAAIDFATAA